MWLNKKHVIFSYLVKTYNPCLNLGVNILIKQELFLYQIANLAPESWKF